MEMSIVLASFVSTERNENLLTVMWLLRDPFMAVESVELCCLFTMFLLRYNRQNTLFFAKKGWTWYPTNNCYLMSHLNQTNIERKNCVWTTKYERLLGLCIVRHVESKSVFSFQPIKRLVFTTLKSAKPAARFQYSFYGPETDNYVVWWWWYTLFCKKDESRLRKTKANSIFCGKFSANHNQAQLHLNQKR